jgi:hypothetical protein
MRRVLPGGAKLTEIPRNDSERQVICRRDAAVLEQTARTHRLVVNLEGTRYCASYREGRRLYGMPRPFLFFIDSRKRKLSPFISKM